MPQVDTVIRNGSLVTPSGVLAHGLAVDDGEIVARGRDDSLPDAAETIDCDGKLILPGLVDPHVHIDEEPDTRVGTVPAESGAAALGGVTTFIDFAWEGPGRASVDSDTTLLEGIDHKRAKAEQSYVNYGLHGVLHRERETTLDQIPAAVDAGVTSFKLFIADYPVGVSNGFVEAAFERIADVDGVAIAHTEDPSLCARRTDRLQRKGKGDTRYYPESRPDHAEAMAADDAARMSRETGVKYYGVHTTSRAAADALARHRRDGSQIRAETCTHYTALTRDTHREQGSISLMAPPLRTEDDIEGLFERLVDGTLGVVSTDHAVYSRRSKTVDDWWESQFGVNSIQYSLPVFHEVAVRRRDRSYPFLLRVRCRNPARTFGLPEKGTLEVGTDADIVIFDPDRRWTIDETENASNATYSIYDGTEVSGVVERTIVNGVTVVKNGQLIPETRPGRFIEREVPDWEPTAPR